MLKLAATPRIRRSPYHDAVVAAGATDWSVYNKMLMPMSYGDVEAEYRRLTEGLAMWDVSCQRQVQIQGPGAAACVQYLTARDLSRMKVGQGKYVAMCDHDGTILNDPILIKLSRGRYWFSIADNDMGLWCRAVAAERGFDVEVTEPDVSPMAVQGPLAVDLIADLFGDHVRELKYFWSIETDLDGIPIVLCRSGWSKQGGFELFLEDGSRGLELWRKVEEAGAVYGIGPGTPNHIERVESGLLSFGGDTTPGSNPFEAGMGRFVDIDCEADYIGKAALQRVAKGGPARRLVGLWFADDVADEQPLVERLPVYSGDAAVGTVSAIVHSPRLQRTIGLAQICSDVVAAAAPVTVETPSGICAATIEDLPFV